MSNCDRNYGFSTMTCSGHGFCEHSKCTCDTGWSSRADYELDVSFDCDISLDMVLVLSVMTFIVASISVTITIRSILIYNLSFNDHKSVILVAFLFKFIGISMYALSKIIDPTNYIIGASHGTLTLVGHVMTWVVQAPGWICFVLSLCNILQGYSKVCPTETREKVGKGIQWLRNASPWICIPPFLVFVFHVMILAIPTETETLAIAANLSLFLMFILEGSYCIFALTIFTNAFGDYLKNQSNPLADIKKIHFALIWIYRVLTTFVLGIGPGILVFAIWPYLRRKTTFLLLFTFFFMTLMTLLVVLTQRGPRREIRFYFRKGKVSANTSKLISVINAKCSSMQELGT